MLAVIMAFLLILPFSIIEPNAQVILDRTSYGPGAIVYITIIDRNFNQLKNVVESIDLTQIVDGEPIVEVKITQPTKGRLVLSAVDGSLRDDNGNPVVKAIESGPNTSAFEFLIKLPEDLETNSSVSVIYNDPFELAPTSRKSIPVEENVTIVETRITDQNGKPLTDIRVGQQIIFRSTLQNSMNVQQAYSYILQVKDSNGYTVMLSWISGTLEAKRSSVASIAWTPDATGKHSVEIFLWDNTNTPTPLTLEAKKDIIMVT
jgi:hypothetical protein